MDNTLLSLPMNANFRGPFNSLCSMLSGKQDLNQSAFFAWLAMHDRCSQLIICLGKTGLVNIIAPSAYV
jgi:hypothetical protein